MKKLNLIFIIILSLVVSCNSPRRIASKPVIDSEIAIISQAILLSEQNDLTFTIPNNYKGLYKVGKPYKAKGKTFIPKEYDSYKEQGLASWYGNHHKGQKTANGEIFNNNKNDFTAAHPTLPLPSIVKVTNLKNGKAILVRVNDRGPFTDNRIIDVSKKTAEALGFANKGLTKVEIELLPVETKQLHQALNLK